MIQWYPGHMAKAFQQVKAKAQLADLFIIVLDARAPFSSYNAMFEQISPQKPRLFVITKLDLADPEKLQNIKQSFQKKTDQVLVLNLKSGKAKQKILRAAVTLLEPKRLRDAAKGILKPRLRAFVLGVPNAGKSTLINLLAAKKQTKVGNMPGITRGQQWINAGQIQLLDTPGILWPKFDDMKVGIKLAMIGAIKIEVIPQQMFVLEAYKILSRYYPSKIVFLQLKPSFDKQTIYNQMQILGRRKVFFLKDQTIDLKRTFRYFINYLRTLKSITYD